MRIRARRLERDGVIGVVAPASAPPSPLNVDRAVAALEALGFKVRLGRHVRRRLGFLAGTDRERAADLMAMFADRRVDAIVCVRGGYGTGRLLPLLDYRTIRAHPKILVGYSDVTALHCALWREAGLVSFHGPMLNPDFAHANMPAFTLESFLRVLTQPTAAGSITNGYRARTTEVLRAGAARGQLMGGNLSLLCSMVGTRWQPPFRGRILFFEDVGEPPYRFDRMLTHLLNAGLLQQVAGIAIGINRGCADPQAARGREYRQTLQDVLQDRLLPLKVPVVMGLPFGHVAHNATLPLGVRARLDGQAGDLVLEEAAVS